MLISALLHGNMELLILTVPLAAALLAFLRYNFNPASIFLGDSGSLLIEAGRHRTPARSRRANPTWLDAGGYSPAGPPNQAGPLL